MVIGMPGQRKRKQQLEVRKRQQAAVASQEGHWQVIFETQDFEEWRNYLRKSDSPHRDYDPSRLRLDTLCGRLMQPTTYRLSLLVPKQGPEHSV
jgi:hypothetical protein